jgi:Ca2+-binding RTX toxin-like protein
MTVESVGGTALDSVMPGTVIRVVIGISLTIATGAALLLPAPAAHALVIEGTAADDSIVGTPRGDQINALDGDDVVSARAGYDFVRGGAGDDIIRVGQNGGDALGQAGNDTIFGGADFVAGAVVEMLRGGRGRDELIGDADRDWLVMDLGPDTAFGRADRDIFTLAHGRDIARGGPGIDRFEVLPDGLPDQVACGRGTDFVVFYRTREAHDRTGPTCERLLRRG